MPRVHAPPCSTALFSTDGPMIDLLPADAPILALVLGLVAVSLLARRVPAVRVAISLATWCALGAVLFLALEQRQRLDPYFAEVAGLLRPDEQQVVGEELRIRMSPDGHFWVKVRMEGVERRLMVDSGATVTALSQDTATAAGLKARQERFPVLLQTAAGTIRAKTATVAEMRLGNIVARDLAVVVLPAQSGMDVLGMNFLSRLKSWRVEGRTLVLVPHHPQAVTG